jgi:hypothetical protein
VEARGMGRAALCCEKHSLSETGKGSGVEKGCRRGKRAKAPANQAAGPSPGVARRLVQKQAPAVACSSCQVVSLLPRGTFDRLLGLGGSLPSPACLFCQPGPRGLFGRFFDFLRGRQLGNICGFFGLADLRP